MAAEGCGYDISMLKDFFTYVAGEWKTILQAPITFISAGIVVAILIWIFQRWIYSNQFGALNERIKLRDDQLGELEKKLSADSPSEALVKLGEMTAKVEALSIGRWEAMTQEQMKLIRDKLRQLPSALVPAVVNVTMTSDGRGIGYPLAEILDGLNWNMNTTPSIGLDPGIEIYPNCEAAIAFADALRAAGVDVRIQEGQKQESNNFNVDIGEKPYPGARA